MPLQFVEIAFAGRAQPTLCTRAPASSPASATHSYHAWLRAWDKLNEKPCHAFCILLYHPCFPVRADPDCYKTMALRCRRDSHASRRFSVHGYNPLQSLHATKSTKTPIPVCLSLAMVVGREMRLGKLRIRGRGHMHRLHTSLQDGAAVAVRCLQ